MTVKELGVHVEQHNNGQLYVRTGPKTFTKLQSSLKREFQNAGENWFDYWGLRIICPDRRALFDHQNENALEHLANVLSGYDWGIEE